MTSVRYTAKESGVLTGAGAVGSLHVAHEPQDLDRVGTQLLRELVLDRLGGLLETGLVDVLDDLHADLLELRRRLLLELEGHGRLALGDLVGRLLHPLLLRVAQAVPRLVADPETVVVRLVLR